MSTSHATLSAAADDRKARLAKLKNLKRKQPADEIAPPESERSASPPAPLPQITDKPELEHNDDNGLENDVTRLHLSGRNYDAEAKGAKLGFEAPPTATMEGPTLEQQAAVAEAEIRRKAAEDAKDDKGIDLFKLQPKKPNWDLKRDLDKKLEVLNVRTDNAIAKLVRERITNAQAMAAEKKKKTTTEKQVGNGEESEETAGVDGVALVEGLRVREREDEEEERRERDEDDAI
ncbi:cwf18 pre-mRNA splicing factor-domain-containing protein [Annulohypoxylon maeteangense]|uniref:cwf18 pre-mRNA splicing factor-domain-containing protein n=1 Tax=Annulohypoxylon maeteangense TaxID=1927788 RepID=UPI002007552C|nr:cwf18 pre-mRNA splicing factor-domain-containing protein [Annulohypoxylon maeteangense]KAI0881771.1 cwf18 pre-mRNA splicing factor-domain-containing protein [Annulohypoxylon maeteangense]